MESFEVGEEVSGEPFVSELKMVKGRREKVESSGRVEMLEAKEVLGREGGRERGKRKREGV